MKEYVKQASLDNIKENLSHMIADFLDDESVKLDEAIGGFSDPVKRENSELHIRMTEAAMKEYINTICHEPLKQLHNPLTALEH